MTSTIHLRPEGPSAVDGHVVMAARIEPPEGDALRLWYRVPEKHEALLSSGCDPFVIASIFLAMRGPADLVVHGQVSPSLLRNMEEFVAAWHSWRPQLYSRIEVRGENEVEFPGASADKGAVIAFSGGVDSAFTAYMHARGRRGRQTARLSAGAMVHGFDIPLEKEDGFEGAYQRSSVMLESLGLEPISVATNVREVENVWVNCHGAALASTLVLLNGGFSQGIIASSWAYVRFTPGWGSNPLTDAMMSSKSFRIIHDGCSVKRIDKVAELANWPEALRHLRVCWENERSDVNCGVCEKCIRTRLMFRASGARDLDAFPVPLTDSQIRSVRYPSYEASWYEDIICRAKENGFGRESWVGAIRSAIRRNRARNFLKAVKRIYRRRDRSHRDAAPMIIAEGREIARTPQSERQATDRKIHLWPEELERTNNSLTLSATIELPNGQRQRLWYRLPEKWEHVLPSECNPLVIGTVMVAMSERLDMAVHGTVSPSLLRNLEKWQEVWQSWLPGRYHAVEVTADEGRERVPSGSRRAAVLFSGGVDSTYTLWRHARSLVARRRLEIGAGVMILGFNFFIDRAEELKQAADGLSATLEDVGADLIPVTTNFRDVCPDWYDYHGAGLASAVAVVSGGFDCGLIPATYPYARLRMPFGSTPLTDRMFSSECFTIVHDGAETPRAQKVQEISEWPKGLGALRVCAKWPVDNCGVCEKCIVTILGFQAHGLPVPPAFGRLPSDRQVASLRVHEAPNIADFEEVLRVAAANGLDRTGWAKSLRKCVRRNRSKERRRRSPLFKGLRAIERTCWRENPLRLHLRRPPGSGR